MLLPELLKLIECCWQSVLYVFAKHWRTLAFLYLAILGREVVSQCLGCGLIGKVDAIAPDVTYFRQQKKKKTSFPAPRATSKAHKNHKEVEIQTHL